jgi:hypothetical protein
MLIYGLFETLTVSTTDRYTKQIISKNRFLQKIKNILLKINLNFIKINFF